MNGSKNQARRALKEETKFGICSLCEGFLAEHPNLRVPHATETAEAYYKVSTHTTWYGRLLHDQTLASQGDAEEKQVLGSTCRVSAVR